MPVRSSALVPAPLRPSRLAVRPVFSAAEQIDQVGGRRRTGRASVLYPRTNRPNRGP